ncbi:MAG: VOC family protein [Corynebacteriales bacterium]|nr:VOC family protein [Mycobacteriales bacterium]
MASSLWSIVIDSHDPHRLGVWWARVLNYEIVEDNEEGLTLRHPKGEGPALDFLPVPDEKVVKNRLHLDLNPDDRNAEVQRLIQLGASRVDIGQGDDVSWVVLADPEGNEFCVLQAR